MKKSLIALAVLAASSAAMAESSVTLFGVVDGTLKYGKGTASDTTTLGSNGNMTSRLGFRGVRDFGDGLSGSFHLEEGFSENNGIGQNTSTNNQSNGVVAANGPTFNRRSTISLIGGFGEVRLGREPAAIYNLVSTFDPFGDNGVGATLLDGFSLSSIIRSVRVSNAVSYYTPASLGGFYAQAQYYTGGNSADTVVAGVTTVGKQDGTGYGVQLGYAAGPLNIATSFGSTKYVGVPINLTIAGDESTVNFGVSYDFGSVKLLASAQQDQIQPVGAQVTGQGYQVSAIVPVGKGQILFSYGNYAQKLNLMAGDPTVSKLSLGYVRDIAKDAVFYTSLAFLQNQNNSGAVLNSAVLSSKNDNSNGLDIGLRYKF